MPTVYSTSPPVGDARNIMILTILPIQKFDLAQLTCEPMQANTFPNPLPSLTLRLPRADDKIRPYEVERSAWDEYLRTHRDDAVAAGPVSQESGPPAPASIQDAGDERGRPTARYQYLGKGASGSSGAGSSTDRPRFPPEGAPKWPSDSNWKRQRRY